LDENEVTAKEYETATTGKDINNEEVTKLFGSMSTDPYPTNPEGDNETKLFEGLFIYTHPTLVAGNNIKYKIHWTAHCHMGWDEVHKEIFNHKEQHM